MAEEKSTSRSYADQKLQELMSRKAQMEAQQPPVDVAELFDFKREMSSLNAQIKKLSEKIAKDQEAATKNALEAEKLKADTLKREEQIAKLQQNNADRQDKQAAQLLRAERNRLSTFDNNLSRIEKAKQAADEKYRSTLLGEIKSKFESIGKSLSENRYATILGGGAALATTVANKALPPSWGKLFSMATPLAAAAGSWIDQSRVKRQEDKAAGGLRGTAKELYLYDTKIAELAKLSPKLAREMAIAVAATKTETEKLRRESKIAAAEAEIAKYKQLMSAAVPTSAHTSVPAPAVATPAPVTVPAPAAATPAPVPVPAPAVATPVPALAVATPVSDCCERTATATETLVTFFLEDRVRQEAAEAAAIEAAKEAQQEQREFLEKLVDGIKPTGQDVKEEKGPGLIERMKDYLLGILGGAGLLGGAGFIAVGKKILSGIANLGKVLLRFAGPIALTTAVLSMLDWEKDIFNPIKQTVEMFSGGKWFQGIIKIITLPAELIGKFILRTASWLSDLFGWENASKQISKFADNFNILNILKDVGQIALDAIDGIKSSLISLFRSAKDKFMSGGWLAGIADAIYAPINFLGSIGSKLGATITGMLGFDQLSAKLTEWGKNFNIIDAIDKGVSMLIDKLASWTISVGGWIGEKIGLKEFKPFGFLKTTTPHPAAPATTGATAPRQVATISAPRPAEADALQVKQKALDTSKMKQQQGAAVNTNVSSVNINTANSTTAALAARSYPRNQDPTFGRTAFANQGNTGGFSMGW